MFLRMLEEYSYEVKQGKNTALKGKVYPPAVFG